MQIARHKVATIDYTLRDTSNTVIDTSVGAEPLTYIHGTHSIIPGLERALLGKSPGDKFSVSIAAADAYGESDDSLMEVVPKDRFEEPEQLEVGMQFQTPTDDGMQVITVVKVSGTEVTVDGNHPLAGLTLNFDVEVMDVRDATAEELDHGHVHGPDGHHHH